MYKLHITSACNNIKCKCWCVKVRFGLRIGYLYLTLKNQLECINCEVFFGKIDKPNFIKTPLPTLGSDTFFCIYCSLLILILSFIHLSCSFLYAVYSQVAVLVGTPYFYSTTYKFLINNLSESVSIDVAVNSSSSSLSHFSLVPHICVSE